MSECLFNLTVKVGVRGRVGNILVGVAKRRHGEDDYVEESRWVRNRRDGEIDKAEEGFPNT